MEYHHPANSTGHVEEMMFARSSVHSFASFIAVSLLLVVPAFTQTGRSEQSARVKSLITDVAKRSPKATLLTRALVVKRGKIVGAGETSFDLRTGKRTSGVKYEEVLEISAGGKALSFATDAPQQHYGTWEDVGRIYPATKLIIILTDGKPLKAFSNSATSTHLVVMEREHYERIEVPRDRIEAVYGLVGGYGGVKAGASKGAEAMHAGRDKLLGGALTGVAALIGLVKSDGRPILIFSK